MAISDSLLAWYKFQDIVGGVTTDSSDSGSNAATIVEGPGSNPIVVRSTNDSRFSHYLEFDLYSHGSSINVPQIYLSSDPGFTITAFVKPNGDLSYSPDSFFPFLLNKSGGNQNHPIFLQKADDVDGAMHVSHDCYGAYTPSLGGLPVIDGATGSFNIWDVPLAGSTTALGLADLPNSSWSHLAITFQTETVDVNSGGSIVDPINGDAVSTIDVIKVSVFIDGVASTINLIYPSNQACNVYETYIEYINGGPYDNANPVPFLEIADVGIWNRTLSNSEIYSVSQAGISNADTYVDGGNVVGPTDSEMIELSEIAQTADPGLDLSQYITFGESVSIHNNVAAVIARKSDNTATIFVFEYSGETWTYSMQFTPTGELPTAGQFNTSKIKVSENIIVAGEFVAAGFGGTLYSHVYIFEKSAGVWTLTGDILSDSTDDFGRALDVAASTIVIGARKEYQTTAQGGEAYVINKDSNGDWPNSIQPGTEGVAILRASNYDSSNSDHFGTSVAIDEASSYIVVGSLHQSGVGFEAGSIYVFEKDVTYDTYGVVGGSFQDGSGAQWYHETTTLQPADLAPGDLFGQDVSISGNNILVGSRRDDDNGEDSGSAYVFSRSEAGTWSNSAKISPADGAANHQFGNSVDINGLMAVVGAYKAEVATSSPGAIYIYEKPYDSNEWSFSLKVTPEPPINNYGFGLDVDFYSKFAIIGTNGIGAYIYNTDYVSIADGGDNTNDGTNDGNGGGSFVNPGYDPCNGNFGPECGLGRRYDSTAPSNINALFQIHPALSAGPSGGLINDDNLKCLRIPSGWQTAFESQKLFDEMVGNIDTIMSSKANFTDENGDEPTDIEFAIYKKSLMRSLNGLSYRHALSLRTINNYNITWPESTKTAVMKTQFDMSSGSPRLAKHGKVALQEMYSGVNTGTKYCGIPASIDSITVQHGVVMGGGDFGNMHASYNSRGSTEYGDPTIILDIVLRVPKDEQGISSGLGWGSNANAKILWAIDKSSNASSFSSDDQWFFNELLSHSNYGYISLACPGWVEGTDSSTGDTLLSIRVSHNLIQNTERVWGDWDPSYWPGGSWADHSANHVSYEPNMAWGSTLFSEDALNINNREFKIRAGIFEGVEKDLAGLALWGEAEDFSEFVNSNVTFDRPMVSSVDVVFSKISDSSQLSFTDNGDGTFTYDDYDWNSSLGDDLNLAGQAVYGYLNSNQSSIEYANNAHNNYSSFTVDQTSSQASSWIWSNLDESSSTLLPPSSGGTSISRVLDMQSVPSDGQFNVSLEVEGVTASFGINLLDTPPSIIHPLGTTDILVEIRNDSGDDNYTWLDPELNNITLSDDLDDAASLALTVTGNTFDRRVLTAYQGNPGTTHHVVTYSTTDSAGNTSSITRNLYVIDTTPPVISLTGTVTGPNNPEIFPLVSASSWSEPGYSVLDNSDIDSTNGGSTTTVTYQYWDHDTDLWVDSPTDPSTTFTPSGWDDPSDYGVGLVGNNGIVWKIKYEATDSWGNVSSAERYVGFAADSTAPVFSVSSLSSYTIELTATHSDSDWNNADNFLDDSLNAITASDPEDGGTSTVTTEITFLEPSWLGGSTETVLSGNDPIDTSRAGLYKINFNATNNSGLTSTLTRVIEVVDTTPPVITLAVPMDDYVPEDTFPLDAARFAYSISDISDNNSLNSNINEVQIEIVDQAGSSTSLGNYQYTGSDPDQTGTSAIVNHLQNQGATDVPGVVIVKYTPIDRAGNAGMVVQKRMHVGCCYIVEDFATTYGIQNVMYAGSINFIANQSGTGPNSVGYWDYSAVSRFDGDGSALYGPATSLGTGDIISLHGAMQMAGVWEQNPNTGIWSDVNGDGTSDYASLCYITDPSNQCRVVGLQCNNLTGQPYWPLGPNWDGKDMIGSTHASTWGMPNSSPLIGKTLGIDPITGTFDPLAAYAELKEIVDSNNENPGGEGTVCCSPSAFTWPTDGPFEPISPPDLGGGFGGDTIVSDKDLKLNIAVVPNPVLTNYHLIGLYTVEFDWSQTATDLFGLSGHVEEGIIAEQLEELYPAPDPNSPPTSKEDGHIWWHEYMTDEQKAMSSGVHNYYTFYNSEMLEAEIQAAINSSGE